MLSGGQSSIRLLVVRISRMQHALLLFSNQQVQITKFLYKFVIPSYSCIHLLFLHILTFSGDVMGPTLNNLHNLIRLPFGCGEQNMIHFAPIVYVMDYLKRTRQLTLETEAEAKTFLVQGIYVSFYQPYLVIELTKLPQQLFGKTVNGYFLYFSLPG